jgi:hypothetical protein
LRADENVKVGIVTKYCSFLRADTSFQCSPDDKNDLCMSISGTKVANLIAHSFKNQLDFPFAAALPKQTNSCGSSCQAIRQSQSSPKINGNQKVLFCSFQIFLASNSTSVATTKSEETVPFTLSSRFFHPSNTLLTIRSPPRSYPRLRKRIAKISSPTNLINIASKQHIKAKTSTWIVLRS